ncbi:hypothetical protein V6C59_16640 [Acinetobacter bereziniae]|uniref:hypothetical protein n=1 Tax=Acinetobacter bereziniae TaxID=106648 RepID=UPI002FD99FBD
MKKFIYILLLIALGWLIKLSYDFYHVSQQLDEIQQTLHKSEQKNASLNDQLVAVKRQADEPSQETSKQPPVLKEPSAGINPSVLIKQQLELVQFAIQQQQFVYALEHLTQINQSLDQYALAEAVKQSLHQSIAQDMQNIQQFVIERNAQQDQLDSLIKQVDQSLTAELKNNQLKLNTSQSAHFWEKWFKVDVLSTDTSELSNRRFILKETQLRLLLAQQLLIKGQNVEYKAMLNQAIQQLDLLPDAASQNIKQQLLKIKQSSQSPVPKLNSLAVLG